MKANKKIINQKKEEHSTIRKNEKAVDKLKATLKNDKKRRPEAAREL